MKKLLFLLLSIVSMLPVFAREVEYTYACWTLTYTILDEEAKTCEVTSGRAVPPYSTTLMIPEIISDMDVDYSVISIGNNAFESYQTLMSVEIPNSVTYIGHHAFYNCRWLTHVHMPDSVTYIGSAAFGLCVGLISAPIPNSVTYIGLHAFESCEKLTSVTIPNSVTFIGDGAFSYCSSLTSITIPNSVTIIYNSTFSMCSSLTKVILPPSIEKISLGAFNGCTRLESIIMGPNLKEIRGEAFKNCPISNIYITTPTPPDLILSTDGFSASPESLRTTFFQNEAIRENYQSELWNKYVFLLEEGGETALMVEPTELSVEGGTSLMGRPGETFQLSAKLYPEDVTLPYVFWRSTNPEIASVDYDGLVTIHADLSEATPLDEGDGSQVACHIIAETLYSDGPIVEIPVGYNQSTGITDVVGGDSSSDIDPNAPVEVFTIQGIKVSDSIDKLSAGIYIVRQGNKVKKISVQ